VMKSGAASRPVIPALNISIAPPVLWILSAGLMLGGFGTIGDASFNCSAMLIGTGQSIRWLPEIPLF
jgi:hypothetical protein